MTPEFGFGLYSVLSCRILGFCGEAEGKGKGKGKRKGEAKGKG